MEARGQLLGAEHVARHLRPMMRAALSLTGTTPDAEDLVQDTLVRLLRRPRVVRNDEAYPYILAALRNTWVSSNRARARRIPTESMPDEPDALDCARDELDDELEARAALALVFALPPRYGQTIFAVDVLGMTYREAATALHVPPGTIMSRLSRGRRSLALSC